MTPPTTPTGTPPRIHEEIQQRKPFRSLSQEALIGLARTASVIERTTAAVLTPHGLSTAQYNVLRILRGSGPAGLPTLAIRERLIDPCAAITRLVDKLEQAGFLTRERTSEDRRQVTCRITGAGLELLAVLDPMVDGIDDRLGEQLSEPELEQFNRVLDRIRQALSQLE